MAELFHGLNPVIDGHRALSVGSFYQSLTSGGIVQWLIDPERAPSAVDLTDALRFITTLDSDSWPERSRS